ncbi:hypothetical protein ABK040_003481 [Willaertia magna]
MKKLCIVNRKFLPKNRQQIFNNISRFFNHNLYISQQQVELSSKSIDDFVNQLKQTKHEKIEKINTLNHEFLYLYSVESQVKKEIEVFQQQVKNLLEQGAQNQTSTFNEAKKASLQNNFGLLLKWNLTIQQLVLKNGLYKLIHPLFENNNLLTLLFDPNHVGTTHNFPRFYVLSLLKARMRIFLALGEYEKAKEACEDFIEKYNVVRECFVRKQGEITRIENEAATLGISVEEYKNRLKKVTAKDRVEEVVNKMYELEQEQTISFPNTNRAIEFDTDFGIDSDMSTIEKQLNLLEQELQLTYNEIKYCITLKNEGNSNSIHEALDLKLRDAKLLNTFSNVLFKVEKATILAAEGRDGEEASKLFIEALQQITKNFPETPKELIQVIQILLNQLLYKSGKRNPSQDILNYMSMAKLDNQETSPEVRNLVILTLIDLFTSRGQLDAALNYVDLAKSVNHNSGCFSFNYASILRREGEILALKGDASSDNVLSLLTKALELYTEQYTTTGRFYPLYCAALVNYCKQNNLTHDKLEECKAALQGVNVNRLQSEEKNLFILSHAVSLAKVEF